MSRIDGEAPTPPLGGDFDAKREEVVSLYAYESAVAGRADFRKAFLIERAKAVKAEDALAEIHAILDREIAGATKTLEMDLHEGSRRGAQGWLSAARGIQIAVTKVWPRNVLQTETT